MKMEEKEVKSGKYSKGWWINRYNKKEIDSERWRLALEKVNGLLIDARDEIERLKTLPRKIKGKFKKNLNK